MRKSFKTIIVILLLFLFLLICLYFGLGFYYHEGFGLNTWINGVYCTGRSIDEVNKELLDIQDYKLISITDYEGKVYSFPSSDINVVVDYDNSLKKYISKQNPLLWIDNIFIHKEHTILPDISFDYDKLQKVFDKLNFVVDENEKPANMYIKKSENDGFVIVDNLKHRLDIKEAYSYISDELNAGNFDIVLDNEELYVDYPVTDEYRQMINVMDIVEAFQNQKIRYDLGDEIRTLTKKELSNLLIYDDEIGFLLDDNKPIISDEAIEELIYSLFEEYNTYDNERQFYSCSRGECITVEGITYGTLIDNEAEINYLTDLLTKNSPEETSEIIHTPTYLHYTNIKSKNDIGDTYIEIDITNQHLYYYENSDLKIDTDVVTGNMKRGYSTPAGVFSVYNKQRNRILRGTNYASFVKYWMPVYKGVGIHDASWRSDFGGDIYESGGSHGCINVPSEVMPDLYEIVEVGTPVIMYY